MPEATVNRMRIALDTKSHSPKVDALHILPCHIKYSGPAPVSEYFQPTDFPVEHGAVESKESGLAEQKLKEAYFRGRRLIGTQVDVPSNCVGHVFDTTRSSRTVAIRNARRRCAQEDEPSGDTSQIERKDEEVEEDKEMEELTEWQTRARFDNVVVYGNASKVEKSDVVVKGIQEWFALANAIHGDDE